MRGLADLIGLQVWSLVGEESMVDLKTLGIIDERLRDIFLDNSSFEGLNVVVTGVNWQLQPVGGHSLFKLSRANLELIDMKALTRC